MIIMIELIIGTLSIMFAGGILAIIALESTREKSK